MDQAQKVKPRIETGRLGRIKDKYPDINAQK